MKVAYYSDPSHGWVKVSKKLLKKLGIADKISTYSYMRGDYAYLEEDCDASLFHAAMKNHGKTIEYVEKTTNRSSKIRSYVHYRAD